MTLEISYHIGQDAADNWPQVAGYVAQALAKTQGELVLSDFPAGFLANHFHLFLGRVDGEVKVCMITENVNYPQFKVMRVVIAAGAGLENFMRQFLDYIKAWAKYNGADYLEAWTLPGMTRYHRRFGAKKVYEIIRFSTGD